MTHEEAFKQLSAQMAEYDADPDKAYKPLYGNPDALRALLGGYEAEARDSKARKETDLTPIYTCGGHGGYYDDDDEDFWCPMCHEHLGTHKGYATICTRCGQHINSDSEPIYEYREMYHSVIEWRGPEPGGEENQ